jgi:hypothetical protein
MKAKLERKAARSMSISEARDCQLGISFDMDGFFLASRNLPSWGTKNGVRNTLSNCRLSNCGTSEVPIAATSLEAELSAATRFSRHMPILQLKLFMFCSLFQGLMVECSVRLASPPRIRDAWWTGGSPLRSDNCAVPIRFPFALARPLHHLLRAHKTIPHHARGNRRSRLMPYGLG